MRNLGGTTASPGDDERVDEKAAWPALVRMERPEDAMPLASTTGNTANAEGRGPRADGWPSSSPGTGLSGPHAARGSRRPKVKRSASSSVVCTKRKPIRSSTVGRTR